MLETLIRVLEFPTRAVGVVAAWLVVPLVLVTAWEIFLRYALNAPTAWGFEFATWITGANWVLGAALALAAGAHVRTDVLSHRFPPRLSAAIDLLGYLCLALPMLTWLALRLWEHFAEMASIMPSLSHIAWERVAREGSVSYPTDGPRKPGHQIPFGENFPTGHGRARSVPARLGDPAELPDQEFPFVLTTGRQLEHRHTGSMTRRTGVLDALEPSPSIPIAPATLRRLGVEPGATLRVTTRRGSVTLAARADPGLPETMAFIPFAYREAAANILTKPQLDPSGKIPEFKYSAARIEKVEHADA